jgi:glucokinase
MQIGVDIGGTKTAVMVAADGDVLTTLVQPTDVGQLVEGVKRTIEAAVETVGRKLADIQAIGIGIPGMVNRASGTVELATNLQILQPLPLAGVLSAEFNCPVLLENDVRIAALGVYATLRVANLAYLSIGTGVAAGIILDGKLWRGSHGMAGEVGHLTVDAAGTIFEQLVAGPAIIKQARAFGLSAKRASDVFRLAEAGEAEADLIVEQVCAEIGRMIQWLIMSYDVEKVVLGGGVAQIGDSFLQPVLGELARLRSQSTLNARMLPDSKVALLPKAFNAGLHGAVALAQEAQNNGKTG